MVSHPKTGSDSPIGSDRDRGRDKTYGPIVGKSREKVEPLSLSLPLKYGLPYSLFSFSLFLFLWITLNRILKRRKLPPSFLHATCPLLDFFLYFFCI